MVEAIYKKDFELSAGDVNAEGELSLPVLTANIIDVATEHANRLGIGNPNMSGMHAGWVLSRISIEMEKFPCVNQNYTIETWISVWNRHFSERCFRVADSNGTTLGFARSIWMVISTDSHENVGLSHLSLTNDKIADKECEIARQEKHKQILAQNADENLNSKALVATSPDSDYRFKYCDLDFYRHVNTVRYVSLLLNQFSLKQHDENRVKRMELSFMNEARYDMTVTVRRAQTSELENSFLLFEKESQKPILYSRLFFEKRV